MTKILNIQKRPFSKKRREDSFQASDELLYELSLTKIGLQTKNLAEFHILIEIGPESEFFENSLTFLFLDRFGSIRAHMKARQKLEKNLLFVF